MSLLTEHIPMLHHLINRALAQAHHDGSLNMARHGPEASFAGTRRFQATSLPAHPTNSKQCLAAK